MTTFIERLRGAFRGEIALDAMTREKMSRDASLFEVKPAVVLYPKDTADVQTIVKTAVDAVRGGEKVSLTARAAGTDMSGGPLTESVVVEFPKYFNHVLEVGDGYAVAEPGVYYRDFDKETKKKGQILPSYPASRDLCTVGGMIANNSGGEKTLFYGKTEDYVEELEVVLRDGEVFTARELTLPELEAKKQLSTLEGEIYRRTHELIEKNYDLLKNAKPKVSKNSAGYYLWNVLNKEKGTFDLTKLLVGSQGTLGLVTKARFKLVKPRPYSRLLVVFLTSMDHVPEVAKAALAHKPESIESYDDHSFKLAIKVLPGLIKKLGGNVIKLGFQFLPDVWKVVTGGIPKLVVLIEFTDETPEGALLQAKEAEVSMLKLGYKTRVTVSESDANKYWVVRRESFNLLRQHVHHMRTAPFIDDFIVRPEYLGEFLPKLYTMLDAYNLIYTVAGHVGDGNFHIIPLIDPTRPDLKQIITELSDKVYDLVLEYHGSITAEHNDGLIRTPFLKQMYGPEVYALFEEVKNIFDPENLFNPGKKVGATLDYALNHLDTIKA